MATIHDYARMCRSFGGRCSICPLNKLMGYTKNCGGVLFIHASEASAIIDKWCAEHPQKTYLQDFLEKFPKAEKMGNGLPYISPCRLYGEVFKCTVRGCSGCWNAVMPKELRAARDAAWDAARDAAWDAARDAARDASRAAGWAAANEHELEILLELLEEGDKQ